MAAGGGEHELLKKEELEALGLDAKKVKMVLGNSALLANMSAAVRSVGETECDGNKGNLYLKLASELQGTKSRFMPLLASYIKDDRHSDTQQVHAAVIYVNNIAAGDDELDVAGMESASGVGVELDASLVRSAVSDTLESVRSELEEERYLYNTRKLVPKVLEKDGNLKWMMKEVLAELDGQVGEILGPRTAADEEAAKGGKKKSKKKPKKEKKEDAKKEEAEKEEEGESAASILTAFRARDLQAAVNSRGLIAEHEKVTGGVVRTRFPPEPNGYLHIGHAKSMNLNFRMAFDLVGVASGETIFRYDDTNPEAESHEYIDSQADNVSWLGWRPIRTTFSSDYFDELYDLAEKLIRLNKAFVCHQTRADMEKSREAARNRSGDPNSPWRDRPIEESLREFRRMRDGCYGEGEATLRLKMDMHHPNPVMWDPVAYRVKLVAHPRTGDKWCIYPSYDYTHCIVDSLEHIDYSLCTLEFEIRRDSYYWLLEALDLWRPKVWEFSRLNVTYGLLSKRKIIKLISTNTVRGWDDPRLLTINGLRRRGYTPDAINAFCTEVGVSRSQNMIPLERLEGFIRADLDAKAPRAFVVLEPLKVTIVDGLEADLTIEMPLFPKSPERGNRSLRLTSTIFIDRADWRDEDDPTYFGLAPGKTVGLRGAGNLTCREVIRNDNGRTIEIKASYEHERSSKPKGNLHWLPHDAPTAEVRLYETLFTTPEPGTTTGNWEDDINPDSEIVLPHALVEPLIAETANTTKHFQAERLGYFVVDKDTTPEKIVLNRTVTLRESKGAKAIKKA